MNTTRARPPAIVAGTGFGCRVHVPALRAAGFDVVALVGTDAGRTQRRAEACGVSQVFTDLDEAITRTGAKVVTIATTPHTHGPLTLAALARGCHVLCEKPFAKDLSEARQMLAAAEQAGVVHLIAHEFRWQPDRALIARVIADGMIGEPRFLTLASYNAQLASPDAKMPDWWFDPQAGGGWLGAQGSHLIDQVRSWLGEFASLSASLPMVSDRQKGAAEDSYSLSFALANGVQGVVQQSAGAWGPTATMSRVAGTHGTLWMDDQGVWLADRDGTRQLPLPPELQLPPPIEPPHPMWALLAPFIRLCEALRSGMEGKLPSAVRRRPLPTASPAWKCSTPSARSAASGGALIKLR